MKKKLVIFDQYMTDYQGHHYNYNKYLERILKKDFNIDFYFNENISKSLLKSFSSNIFKIPSEKKNKNAGQSLKLIFLKFKNILKKSEIIKNFYYSFLKFNSFELNRIFFNTNNISSKFISNLIQIDSKYKKKTFFLHTLSSNEFIDFLNYENFLKKNQNTYFIVYRRDPRELKEVYKLVSSIFKNNNFHLLTDSFKIKDFLCKKKIDVKLINIPIFFENKKKFFEKNKNKNKKIHVTYLGDARKEKGFFKIPSMIKNIDNNFYFNIQSNSNGYDLDEYYRTINELKKIKNLKLFDKQLNEMDYSKLLSKSDIILIPYLIDYYRYRTSGIFFEAILASKIPIIPENTWMSSFYKDDKTLERLIIKNDYELEKILNFIKINRKNILIKIFKLKKNIEASQIKFNLANALRITRKNKSIIKKINPLIFNYIIDDHTVNRRKDGNQWGSSYLFNTILKNFNNKKFINKVNILFNKTKLDEEDKILVKENFYKNFSKKYVDIDVIPSRRYFILRENNLSFNLIFDLKKLNIADYTLVNFHYYKNLIKSLSILKTKKVLVLVHDQYKYINNFKDFLQDHENIYYFFVSHYEFKKTKLKYSKKYLIYPHNFSKKINNKYNKSKNYNYYFVSSGSEIDVNNIKYLLKKNKFKNKINLIGEIYLKKKQLADYSDRLNYLEYINDLKKIYLDQRSVFIIPRYFGTGIPIKFLECLKYNSKFLLFGNKTNFGFESEKISEILRAKDFINLDRKVDLINYSKVKNSIYNKIVKNNLLNLQKFRKEISK